MGGKKKRSRIPLPSGIPHTNMLRAPEQQVAACTTLATLPLLLEHHETAVLVDLGGLSESRNHTHRTG